MFELKDIRKRYLENKIVGKDFGERCEAWGVSDEISGKTECGASRAKAIRGRECQRLRGKMPLIAGRRKGRKNRCVIKSPMSKAFPEDQAFFPCPFCEINV